MSQINFRENGSFPLETEGQIGDVATGIIFQGRRMIGVKYSEGWIYSFLDNDIKASQKNIKLTTKKKKPNFSVKKTDGEGVSNTGENVGSGSGWYKGMDGAKLQFKTAKAGSDTMLNSTGSGQGSYAPIEIASNTNDLTLSMSSTFVTAFNARISELAHDTTPQLGSILDCQANAIAFNYHSDVQETVASNVCTIDLRDGNNFFVTIGETCTQFNIDFNSNSIINNGIYKFSVIFQQNGGGGYQVSNWNVANDSPTKTVAWQGGTAPTLTTGDNKVDVVTFLSTPSTLYGTFLNNFDGPS